TASSTCWAYQAFLIAYRPAEYDISRSERTHGAIEDARMNETKMTWPPVLPFSTVLARARSLDEQAVSLLYKRFLPTVCRYALARVGDPQSAEDVTSETFFAMLESIGTVRASDELGFAAWLLGIARNKSLMHFRRLRGQPSLVSEYPEEVEAVA